MGGLIVDDKPSSVVASSTTLLSVLVDCSVSTGLGGGGISRCDIVVFIGSGCGGGGGGGGGDGDGDIDPQLDDVDGRGSGYFRALPGASSLRPLLARWN